MAELCEQLKQLKIQSKRLFHKVFSLVDGLNATKHKHTVKFINEHPEVIYLHTRIQS